MNSLLLAAAIASAATVADVESTMALRSRPGFHEANPVMRPFIDNRAQAHAVALSLTMGSIVGAGELRKRGVRKWWLIPVVVTGVHVAATIHNRRQP